MTTKTTHNMVRLSWYNTDEISIQCLLALPNRDGILKNDIFIEAVRCILGLPSHILQPFLDGHHFIGQCNCGRYAWYYGKECNAYQW